MKKNNLGSKILYKIPYPKKRRHLVFFHYLAAIHKICSKFKKKKKVKKVEANERNYLLFLFIYWGVSRRISSAD